MLTPKSSPRGKLLEQYVCGRITSMSGINIGLFDFDRHNALYYFIMNADEKIYMRYGGRDAESAMTYLNLRSLELALEQGLALHRENTKDDHDDATNPPARFPREIPTLVERTIERHNCVECHLIADFENQELEAAGKLDKLTRMFVSPDIKRIGIELDVPRGLVVKQVSKEAELAGLQAGDQILEWDGTRVRTFGDLQYQYNKVARDRTSISLRVLRGAAERNLEIQLPSVWWQTDLEYRYWTVDPLVYFKARALTEAGKREHQLRTDGFASVVTYINPAATVLKRHALQVGDIVYAVDNVDHDALADTCITHIKLRKTAGSSVKLSVLRNGQKLSMKLKTERQSFRK